MASARTRLLRPQRALYIWVENIFNKVDHARISQVGADRAAAEFVLRMGGRVAVVSDTRVGPRVRWVVKDTELPPAPLQLKGADMSGTTVTEVGMQHFQGLSSLSLLGLRDCSLLRDGGVKLLASSPLKALDVSGTQLTAQGIATIAGFKGLQLLQAANMKSLSAEEVSKTVQAALPQCTVVTDASAAPLAQQDKLERFIV